MLATLLGNSTLSVLVVFLSAGIGAYANHIKVLSATSQSTVDKLIANIFLPCLIFQQVTPNMNMQAFVSIWPLTLCCLLTVASGLLMGSIAGRNLPAYRSLLMVAVAFPNSYAVPLTLMLALGDNSVLVAHGNLSGAALSSRINMLYLLSYSLWVLARWSIGFPLMSGAISCKQWRQKVLNPPVVASICAIVGGLAFSYIPSAWLPTVDEHLWQRLAIPLKYGGRCTVPCVLCVLGARIYDAVADLRASYADSSKKLASEPLLQADASKPQESEDEITPKMPISAFFSVLVLRQVVSPCLGAAFCCGVLRPLIGHNDPVLLLVAMLQTAGPPMINLSVMAGLSGSAEMEVAKLLLLTYSFSIVTWSFWVTVFLQLLGN
eukprot:TRINITY_DN69984_c0_g1_i1.p1 TRINITY_DN69984_c0_g1~~TRINITY_DN69984_c0_g1_i1.p1  ORF type:complete len:417 (+),score=61.74 TRINITY_DN69984_c0_g1_i1:119-1252(+)